MKDLYLLFQRLAAQFPLKAAIYSTFDAIFY
jgi:hypothetical protein